MVPTTPFLEGGDVFGPGLGLDLRAGYYMTPHIGIVGGLRLSSHIVKSCEGCKGAGIQLPVLVQFAASRTRGVYGEAGVGLLSIYAVSKGDTTARIATPVVLELDIGRMASVSANAGKSSSSASIDKPTFHVVAAAGLIGHFAL